LIQCLSQHSRSLSPSLMTSHNKTTKVELRDILTARGAGFAYSSAYKLEHDIEQLKYIVDKVGGLKANEIQERVLPVYESMLAKIPPLSELQRTAGLFAFALAPAEAEAIEPYYNRAYHVPDFEPLQHHLHPDLDTAKIERDWAESDPSVVVVDNVLSPECLQMLRDCLAESTVWYETKMPERFGGYVGAYLNDGLHAKVLLALAQELREKLPTILGDHPLRHLWAYKYDDRYTGINLHADQAAVNLNFWITNEDANLNKESGGLVVYTKKPPPHWTFEQYNQVTEGSDAHELLDASGWENVTVCGCVRVCVICAGLLANIYICLFGKHIYMFFANIYASVSVLHICCCACCTTRPHLPESTSGHFCLPSVLMPARVAYRMRRRP
jgi:hypothetical protein